MGREWYHWGAKSSKRKGGGGRREGNSTVAKPQLPPPPPPATAAAAGCMGAVFHLFHLRQLQLHFHHHHHSFDPTQDDPSSLQGVQAPRNSSEAEEVMVGATPSLASVSETEPEGDENSTIKMGIQINTSRRDSMLLRSKSLTPRAKTGEFNNFSTLEHGNSTTQINSSRVDTMLLKVPAPSSKAGDEQNSDVLSSSDCRTPSLVARLMGLDLLPGSCQSSPRPSNVTSQQCNRLPPHPIALLRSRRSTLNGNGNGNGGFLDLFGSLPETHRVFLGGRRSDANGYSYYNRRFSLQMDRGTKMQLIELSRHSCSEINGERGKPGWKAGDDENPVSTGSPSRYARQIMKQVKERVARRRFGADITNKTGERQGREQRRDEYLLSTKEKMSQTQNDTKRADQSGPGGGLSGSSRTRVLEMPTTQVQQPECDPVKERRIFRSQEVALLQLQQRAVREQKLKPVTRSYHDTSEKDSVNVRGRYRNSIAQRRLRLNNKDEQFVRVAMDPSRTRPGQGKEKKCERTPLSSELLHGNVVPSRPLKKLEKHKHSLKVVVSKKKAQAVKLNTTKTLQPRNDLHAPPPPPPPPSTSTTDTDPAATTAEFHYISRILRAVGIDRDTPVSTYTRWFSPSHPLDPALFHRLEAEEHAAAAAATTTTTATSPNEVSLPCNRRLIFDAVDETLPRILWPTDPGRGPEFGFQLMRMVWTKAKGFQDPDLLVEMCLSGLGSGPDPGTDMHTGFMAREGEVDEIVGEIEREMVEMLVLDTVVATGWKV